MMVTVEMLEKIERGLGTTEEIKAVVQEVYTLRWDLREVEGKLNDACEYIESIYRLRDAANGG